MSLLGTMCTNEVAFEMGGLFGSGPVVETGLVWRAAEVSPVLAGFIDIVRAHAATVPALP